NLSGTSMASPVVAGLAALIMAYYPELDAAEVRRVILESATRYADQAVVPPGRGDGSVSFGDLSTTGGVVNAYAAIQMAERLAAAKRNCCGRVAAAVRILKHQPLTGAGQTLAGAA